MLKAKIPSVRELISNGEKAEVIYFRRNFHNKDIATIGLRVTRGLFDSLLARGYVFIGHSSAPVEERFHTPQCFNCQKYGHVSTACKDTSPTCHICAGNHNSHKCDNEEVNQCCVNCSRSTNPHFKAGATTHNARSKDCPIYLRRVQSSKN